MSKRDYNYFKALEEMSVYSVKAAEKLCEILSSYKPTKVVQEVKEIHKIEHSEDEKKHELMKNLVKEFITPIEREDIVTLAQMLDDVTDSIEDIVQKLYIFNVTKLRKEAIDFTNLIAECCKMLVEVMAEFNNFKKSKTIKDSIVKINEIEEKGDELYLESVRRLYVESTDAAELMVWTIIFDSLEKTCDAIEHVANAVESVIMKNS